MAAYGQSNVRVALAFTLTLVRRRWYSDSEPAWCDRCSAGSCQFATQWDRGRVGPDAAANGLRLRVGLQ